MLTKITIFTYRINTTTAFRNGQDKFIISHTGIFVDNGNPNNLWRALEEKCKEDIEFKNKLEIRLMGDRKSVV